MKTLRILLLLLLSTSFISTVSAQMDLDGADLKDQVFVDDLIVNGSACVGQDCVNGENFGFDTGRYKENNLRIHFFDTSSSASFPSNDWRIVINDSSNGGDNYFRIEDSSAGRNPFQIDAGAPSNSLRVDAQGDVGIGTATPVLELHVTDGDSPTLRLEQNGSSGFTPQTWDVAGNETNFFVRDVTNGSNLAFRIRPGSGTDDALFIDSDGDIGMGTDNISGALHVKGDLNSDAFYVGNDGQVGVGTISPNANLTVQSTASPSNVLSVMSSDGQFISAIRENNTTGGMFRFFDATGNEDIRLNTVSQSWLIGSSVGIGTNAPGTLFEVNGTASKPGGGAWAIASDRRLKKNIKDYNDGLDKILSFHPVSFQYNGKAGISDTETTYVGLIAQEAQDVDGSLVSKQVKEMPVKNADGTESKVTEEYLLLDPSAITFMLINSIKEQQAQIEDKDQRIEELESKLDRVELLVSDLFDKLGGETVDGQIDNIDNITLSLDQLPYLKQNVPNPYNKETSIEYFVPEFSKRAEIHFFDNQGRMLKKYPISQNGTGKLNLRSENLPAGTYVYSLFVDGKMVSSKKMSIQ